MALQLFQRHLVLCILVATVATTTRPTAAQESRPYNALMHQARELAEQYRALERESEEAQNIQEQLRNSLTEAFESRQAEQRSEIKALRQKLASAEQGLNERERLKTRIVERKLEDMLSGADADWPKNDSGDLEKKLAFDVIQAGDTVAVYIASILPPNTPGQSATAPPVTSLPSGRVVSGFPLVVASDGTIQLPLIDPVKIAGLSVREAERRINQAYVEKEIILPDRAATILTLVPREDDSKREVSPEGNGGEAPILGNPPPGTSDAAKE